MDFVHDLVEITHLAISAVGALIVIWGVGEAALRFVRVKLTPGVDMVGETDRIRERLGAHLLFSLEIFIGADIISSVVAPSWDNVGMLAAIVVIRTVLSYFLAKEIEQTRKAGRTQEG
jgi:uncharacterized membrane protein